MTSVFSVTQYVVPGENKLLKWDSEIGLLIYDLKWSADLLANEKWHTVTYGMTGIIIN